MMDLTFEEFKDKAISVLNLNLDGYKIKRIKRRTKSLMRRQNIDEYASFLKLLKSNQKFRSQYINHLTINTSEFFRNPKIFTYFEEKVLPELFARKEQINIWSAPCSDGSEPYSIALILKKMKIAPAKFKILGSDINSEILRTAEKATYKETHIKNVPAELLENYFCEQKQKNGNKLYKLKNNIKRLVDFEKKDLINDNFQKQWDIIFSRNFFIYLTKKMKIKIMSKFIDSLNREGYLLLGNTEFIFNSHKYGLQKEKLSFYKKTEKTS